MNEIEINKKKRALADYLIACEHTYQLIREEMKDNMEHEYSSVAEYDRCFHDKLVLLKQEKSDRTFYFVIYILWLANILSYCYCTDTWLYYAPSYPIIIVSLLHFAYNCSEQVFHMSNYIATERWECQYLMYATCIGHVLSRVSEERIDFYCSIARELVESGESLVALKKSNSEKRSVNLAQKLMRINCLALPVFLIIGTASGCHVQAPLSCSRSCDLILLATGAFCVLLSVFFAFPITFLAHADLSEKNANSTSRIISSICISPVIMILVAVVLRSYLY